MNKAALKHATTALKMRAAGYYSAAEIAEKMQIHLGSVYRWISEGEVQATKITGRNYISHASLVSKIGANAARAFGFVGPATPKTVTAAPAEPTVEVADD